MGLFYRILIGIVTVWILLVAFSIYKRRKNEKRYKQKTDTPKYYADPTNLSLYPKNFRHISVEHINGNYLNGFHLKPEFKLFKGVVVTFGGSDGTPSYEVAQVLAGAGFEVLALFYYGMPNQRPSLTKIPLEFFSEVDQYIDDNITHSGPVTIYGLSKGAEIALNLVTLFDSIDNAVLVAPGAYNFSGLDYENYQETFPTATWGGKDLPYINTSPSGFGSLIKFMYRLTTKTPIEFLPTYKNGVKNDNNLEEKRIKVENSHANLLLVAGGDDLMWPSAEMAETIKAARPENTEVVIYENAGHLLYGDRVIEAGPINLAMGGTTKDNAQANIEYMDYLLKQLKDWHQVA